MEPKSEDHEKLQVKIQAFEDKINAESHTPGSVRRYSLDHVSKEERKNVRFSRYNFCPVIILKYEVIVAIASVVTVFYGFLNPKGLSFNELNSTHSALIIH